MNRLYKKTIRGMGGAALLMLFGLIACSTPTETCKTDADCFNGFRCNKIKSKCQKVPVSSCGDGICNQNIEDCNTCTKDCACPAGQVCEPSGTCKDNNSNSPGSCQSDETCPNGQICQNAKCVKGCNESRPCPQGLTCTNNQCVNPSECNPACPTGQTCKAGKCEAENADCNPACPTGQTCKDGKCVSDCSPACPTGQTCKDGKCEPLCAPACPAGQVCKAGNQCVPQNGCTATSCPAGQTCKDGKCVPANKECKPACINGQICQNGNCIPNNSGCTKDSDCQSNEKCDTAASECAQKCSANNPQCPSGETCNTSKGFCEPSGSGGTKCTSNAQCKSTEVCDTQAGECSQKCNSDKDCPSSPREICYAETANKKYCVPGCLNNSECSSGEKCDTQFKICVQACSASKPTCPKGETCNVSKGFCEQGSGSGTPCTKNSQCKSNEVCDTEFGECALKCKNDKDCPAKPRKVCFEETATKKYCIDGCLNNSECGSNEVCDLTFKFCAQKCSASKPKCPTNEKCNVRKGFCEPR